MPSKRDDLLASLPPVNGGGAVSDRLYVREKAAYTGNDPTAPLTIADYLAANGTAKDLLNGGNGGAGGGFIDGPKIDPDHPLANAEVLTVLTNGDPVTVTPDANYLTVDGAMASKTAGTVTFAKAPIPTPDVAAKTARVTGYIKVDKTAGRYSRVGFANAANPTTATADIYVGHTAGTGITMQSHSFSVSLSRTIIEEARCVDGAWYRVTLSWDSVLHQNTTTLNTGKNRVTISAEPVLSANTPADPWYPVDSVKLDPTVKPLSVVARTNSPLGTIKDVTYVDPVFGAAEDNGPIYLDPYMGTGDDVTDRAWIHSKGKAAPLRIIVTAGGSGIYGGTDWAVGLGRGGHPWDAFRKFWRELSDLGYTVMHTKALHEGWGADDHLVKQLEMLNRLKDNFDTDPRIYYLGYSMGGISAWRAIMGRAGFPSIRAAYIVAGAAHLDMYYDVAMYSAIKTRWPDRGALDEPINFDPTALKARGTRVRCVTSTGDTNVVKTVSHDPMKAKFEGSNLFSELVHDGIDHFHPSYWNAQDCVDFFEGADL